ncbi:MAG TPA: FAD-binding oxidoreductase [Acidimicrobiia bacterium]|nr:FAD-binding oxidoreductase [Acidimicrobiia bacterium]
MAVQLATGVGSFRERFGGDILVPGDSGYDEARAVWNGDIDRRPAVIARCYTAEQVADAVAFGRQEGLEIAVRGGGHSFAGFSVCDNGLMITLSEMKSVTVDPAARTVRAGGGATWADVDAATEPHGLAVPGGIVSHTGIAGLTLGGGLGWLTRRAGLSCDNLISAEVVTADGRILTASADSHPDLFWAIRGGGGNFGIVTSFEYRLHEVGPLAQLGLFFWGAGQGAEALRYCRDFVKTVPEDMGVILAGQCAPPAPFVPEEYHLVKGWALLIVGWGSPEEHEKIVAPIRADLPPLFEFVSPIPHIELQKMLDEAYAWGIHAYEKGLYVDELTDEVVTVLADRLPEMTSPLSFLPMLPLSGAYSRVGDDATAFGGRRAPCWAVNIAAAAPDSDALAADRAWVRSFWEALRPHAQNSGGYVNFMSEHDEGRVRSSYGQKYDRLARIKTTYDPDNVFHRNANIKPDPGAG